MYPFRTLVSGHGILRSKLPNIPCLCLTTQAERRLFLRKSVCVESRSIGHGSVFSPTPSLKGQPSLPLLSVLQLFSWLPFAPFFGRPFPLSLFFAFFDFFIKAPAVLEHLVEDLELSKNGLHLHLIPG